MISEVTSTVWLVIGNNREESWVDSVFLKKDDAELKRASQQAFEDDRKLHEHRFSIEEHVLQ